jgi:hypothetical protein
VGILLVCEFSRGVRVCPMCPNCSHGDANNGCQDLFGSNTFAEGDIVGSADGVCISIEAQKSAGSLRGHSQLRVQCVRQNKPLSEVMTAVVGGKAHIVGEYYTRSMCPDTCAKTFRRGSMEDKSHAWPEYSASPELVSKPSCLTSDMGPEKWGDIYLAEHVRTVQEVKQHHVHTLNQKGERVPLLHCRRPDSQTKCKGDFPRTMWLIDCAAVLCQCLIDKNGMSLGGRRSTSGSFQGPQNDENLNGAHPAMCAALRTNSDLQLAYRFALDTYTRADAECQENCVSKASFEDVLEACQKAQDVRAEYACDYQNKRAGKSRNEVKECAKSHRKLRASIACNRPACIGKRHVARLCADAYGKGVTRSQQESINLSFWRERRCYVGGVFSLASTVVFPGRELI